MSLFRLIYNALVLAFYAVRLVLYGIAWVCSSFIVLLVFMGIWGLASGKEPVNPALFYLPLILFAICRKTYPHLKPKSRPRMLHGPAAPPLPPPKASVAQARADDPNEATVIGRLDPKLRDLLRPKAESAPTT